MSPPARVQTAFAPAAGSGPIYAVIEHSGSVPWPPGRIENGWAFTKVLWVAPPDAPGPYLVRGTRLDAPGEVRFGETNANELRLQVGGTATTPGTDWLQWPSTTRLSGPGCYQYQVDHAAGSETIVFKAG